jgi:hypothetical protein
MISAPNGRNGIDCHYHLQAGHYTDSGSSIGSTTRNAVNARRQTYWRLAVNDPGDFHVKLKT